MLDGRIKLRHLRCFLEVAQCRSVVRAAEGLNISQPAATKSIQELEAILGTALFDRSRRQLALTTEGEIFFRAASASLTTLRQGLQTIAQGGGAERVVVSVGALPTVSARVLPTAALHLDTDAARIRLRVVTGPNAYLLAQLRQGELDLVVGRMGELETMRGLAFEHLYSETIALAVRPGHPLLTMRPFALPAMLAYQILLPPPDAAIHATVERFLLVNNMAPPPNVIETVSLAFARNYIRKTDALWAISEGVVAQDFIEGLLDRLPVDMADTSGPVGLTTRADDMLTVAAQQVARAVRAAVPLPLIRPGETG